MRYLILLYGDENGEGELSVDDRRAIVDAHLDLTRRLRESGTLVDNGPLEPPASGRVLRRRNGQPIVTDGPFAETKEQLGGFYLLECADLDEALAWAEQVPQSPGLVVEVRPLAAV